MSLTADERSHDPGSEVMTRAQAREVERIRHRYGRCLTSTTLRGLVRVDVVGDQDDRPTITIALEPRLGRVVAVVPHPKPRAIKEYDRQVLGTLAAFPDHWLGSAAVAIEMYEPTRKVSKALSRLAKAGLVDSLRGTHKRRYRHLPQEAPR